MKTVRIKTGLNQVQLPDGNAYDSGDRVELTDAEYADLASTALGDEVLLVANAASFGDSSDISYFHLPITLSAVANGDLVDTTFTPGFAGTVKSVRFITDVASTTAAKATTLGLKIGAVAVTGGSVALTSANTTPAASIVAGSAVTATNTFTSGNSITVVASATTAFVEGSGFLEVLVLAS